MSSNSESTTPFDVVNSSTEGNAKSSSSTMDNSAINLNLHKHNHNHISLSDLPPLHQLDECSEEVRQFAMSQIITEGDFRRSHLDKLEDNRHKEAVASRQLDSKEKITSGKHGMIIVISALIWSGVMIALDQTFLAMTPFIVGVTSLILAAVYGKIKKDSPDSATEESDEE